MNEKRQQVKMWGSSIPSRGTPNPEALRWIGECEGQKEATWWRPGQVEGREIRDVTRAWVSRGLQATASSVGFFFLTCYYKKR